MATPEQLEIYKQRYETFRHLDRLRWQMLQISVAVAPLIIAFGARTDAGPVWWVMVVAGTLLVVFAWVMERIRQGINKNTLVLQRIAAVVGDTGIPTPTHPLKSVAFGVSLFVFLVGVFCLVLGVGAAQFRG